MLESYHTIGRNRVALDPRFPVGNEFGREFFAFGVDSGKAGAKSGNNSTALCQIPCQAAAGNPLCPRREFFMGGKEIIRLGRESPRLPGRSAFVVSSDCHFESHVTHT
jgi:hypothetical protein